MVCFILILSAEPRIGQRREGGREKPWLDRAWSWSSSRNTDSGMWMELLENGCKSHTRDNGHTHTSQPCEAGIIPAVEMRTQRRHVIRDVPNTAQLVSGGTQGH